MFWELCGKGNQLFHLLQRKVGIGEGERDLYCGVFIVDNGRYIKYT